MVVQERELLGTLVRLLCEENFEEVMEAAFLECERIEKKFSRFLEGSIVTELKKGGWIVVDEETLELLRFGLELQEKEGGCFNIAVGGVLEAWGYDAARSFGVGEGSVGRIEIDGNKVRCEGGLDLGAYGKGYAVDKMVEVFDEAGCKNFCVNAGGDIFARGPEWKVLFEHPDDMELAIGEVLVDGFAVACSKADRRKWADKHHLVDAVAGKPADDLKAVYVQAESAMLADAYATAIFVGINCADLPVEFMLVKKDGEILKSKGFQGDLYKS